MSNNLIKEYIKLIIKNRKYDNFDIGKIRYSNVDDHCFKIFYGNEFICYMTNDDLNCFRGDMGKAQFIPYLINYLDNKKAHVNKNIICLFNINSTNIDSITAASNHLRNKHMSNNIQIIFLTDTFGTISISQSVLILSML